MRSKTRRALGLVLLVGGVTLAALAGTSAFAAGGSTTANANVNNTLSLTGLTSSFSLTGDPSTTATQTGAVSMNVTTNNRTGYSLKVQAASANMAGAATGNTDTIPVSAMSAKDSAAGTYNALSNTSAATLKTTSAKTSNSGDNLSDDYKLDIPFVNADTYSVTLNYTATANP
jgi:hypothetical protein